MDHGDLLVSALCISLYLGIGATVHGIFVGPTFAPDSVWSWAAVLGWSAPIVALIFIVMCVQEFWAEWRGR